MNVEELLAADRKLTDEETAFLEQEVLKLAKQLQSMVTEITAEVGPEDQDLVDQLRGAAGRTVANIEEAIALGPVAEA